MQIVMPPSYQRWLREFSHFPIIVSSLTDALKSFNLRSHELVDEYVACSSLLTVQLLTVLQLQYFAANLGIISNPQLAPRDRCVEPRWTRWPSDVGIAVTRERWIIGDDEPKCNTWIAWETAPHFALLQTVCRSLRTR